MSHLEQSYRTVAEISGLVKSKFQEFPAHEVKELPYYFYCEWIKDEATRNKVKEHCAIEGDKEACFNHQVGLPQLKADEFEGPPMPLFNYQKKIMDLYEHSNYYAQNKCRGAGTTELKIVRFDAWKYMNVTNVGRKCLILAGINQEMAIVFLHRMKLLLDKIPDCYLFQPQTDFPTEIFFAQGGVIMALPANPNAVRSLENVGEVDYDESAHWTRVDDTPVLKAGEPHVSKSKAHVNHFSTPSGKKKFFWDYIFDPERTPATKYTVHTLNWREVVGIPEPDPLMLEGVDFNNHEMRQTLDRLYLKRYEEDREYRQWFNDFFPGRDIKEILDVPMPILDVKEIVTQYKTDRANYDQEFDNQFILTENRALAIPQTTDEDIGETFVPLSM